MRKAIIFGVSAALGVALLAPRGARACGRGGGGYPGALVYALGPLVVGLAATDVVLTLWDTGSMVAGHRNSIGYAVGELMVATPPGLARIGRALFEQRFQQVPRRLHPLDGGPDLARHLDPLAARGRDAGARDPGRRRWSDAGLVREGGDRTHLRSARAARPSGLRPDGAVLNGADGDDLRFARAPGSAWQAEPARAVGSAAVAVLASRAAAQQDATDTAAVLEAAACRILPSDDRPGAREANVGRFIERQLAGELSGLRPAFEQLARLLDLHARRVFHVPFAALTQPDQDAVLGQLSRGRAPGARLPAGRAVPRAAHADAGGIPLRPRARWERWRDRLACDRVCRPALAQAGRSHGH